MERYCIFDVQEDFVGRCQELGRGWGNLLKLVNYLGYYKLSKWSLYFVFCVYFLGLNRVIIIYYLWVVRGGGSFFFIKFLVGFVY